jgi:hypothetical protein
MASAPEQMGLLELSVAATGEAYFTVEVAVNGRDTSTVTYVSKI